MSLRSHICVMGKIREDSQGCKQLGREQEAQRWEGSAVKASRVRISALPPCDLEQTVSLLTELHVLICKMDSVHRT